MPRVVAPLDALLISVLGAAALGSIPLMRAHAPAEVVVHRDNSIIATYPINEDRVVALQGKLGAVTVTINDNRARITTVTCPRHLCMHSAPLTNTTQQIVCVPNHLMIRLQSRQSSEELDAVAE